MKDKTMNPAPADRKTLMNQLITKLFEQEVQVDGNINDMALIELLNQLSKKTGVKFAIAEECFKAENISHIREKKPNVAASGQRGLSLHRFLSQVLQRHGCDLHG